MVVHADRPNVPWIRQWLTGVLEHLPNGITISSKGLDLHHLLYKHEDTTSAVLGYLKTNVRKDLRT